MERGRVSYTNGETIAPGDSLYQGYSEVVPGLYRGRTVIRPRWGRDPSEGRPREYQGCSKGETQRGGMIRGEIRKDSDGRVVNVRRQIRLTVGFHVKWRKWKIDREAK